MRWWSAGRWRFRAVTKCTMSPCWKRFWRRPRQANELAWRLHKMKRLTLALVAILATGPVAAQMAKDYPSHPIKVVVPSPPGGPPDLIMRLLGPHLAASL